MAFKTYFKQNIHLTKKIGPRRYDVGIGTKFSTEDTTQASGLGRDKNGTFVESLGQMGTKLAKMV